MISSDFIELKDYILSQNTYFDRGYANAFKDSNSNIPLCRELSGDLISVFPQDTNGGYFYLRNNEGIAFKSVDAMSDCGYSFDDKIVVFLVAILNDADEFTLLNNLRNTCLSYSGMRVIPTAANWNREQITIDEMNGMKDSDIAAALQRWDKQTVIRVRLEITKQFIQSNCAISNPCKC